MKADSFPSGSIPPVRRRRRAGRTVHDKGVKRPLFAAATRVVPRRTPSLTGDGVRLCLRMDRQEVKRPLSSLLPPWEERLLLPGPTPVPWPVALAGARPMAPPRGQGFKDLIEHTLTDLADLIGTSGKAAILPCSGTGALECAVQNFIAPGSRVLAVVAGAFGARFKAIAEAGGAAVTVLDVPLGKAPTADALIEALQLAPYEVLLLTHNETSTGVILPVPELTKAARSVRPDLVVMVDSISGFPSLPLDMDRAGIDVAVAASQKGFMAPPGLGLVGVGPRGLAARVPERPGRFYFDLGPYFTGRLPYTPAISLWYGLAEAISLLNAEGAAARLLRHKLLGRMVRAGGKAMGLFPMVEESIASPTVTALSVPEGIAPKDLLAKAADYGIQASPAFGPWAQRAIRVGHVGAITPLDALGAVAALEASVFDLRQEAGLAPLAKPAAGVSAAWTLMREQQAR